MINSIFNVVKQVNELFTTIVPGLISNEMGVVRTGLKWQNSYRVVGRRNLSGINLTAKFHKRLKDKTFKDSWAVRFMRKHGNTPDAIQAAMMLVKLYSHVRVNKVVFGRLDANYVEWYNVIIRKVEYMNFYQVVSYFYRVMMCQDDVMSVIATRLMDCTIDTSSNAVDNPIVNKWRLNKSYVRSQKACESEIGVGFFEPYFLSFMNSLIDLGETLSVNIFKLKPKDNALRDAVAGFHEFNQYKKATVQRINPEIDKLTYCASLLTAMITSGVGLKMTEIKSPIDALEGIKGGTSTAFHTREEFCSARKADPEALLFSLTNLAVIHNQHEQDLEIFDSSSAGSAGIANAKTQKELDDRLDKRYKDMLMEVARYQHTESRYSLFDMCATAFFRLQPRVSMRTSPVAEDIFKYRFGQDEEFNSMMQPIVEKWDNLVSECNTCLDHVFGNKVSEWKDKGYIPEDFNFSAISSDQILEKLNSKEVSDDYFHKLWEASTKIRLIWAYPMECLITQSMIYDNVIQAGIEYNQKCMSLGGRFINLITNVSGLDMRDWAKRFEWMQQSFNVSDLFDGDDLLRKFNSQSGTTSCNQYDAAAFDQHWEQWAIIFTNTAFMSTVRLRDRFNKPVSMINDWTIAEMALYECFTPIITAFHSRRVSNAAIASGSKFTLLGNNAHNVSLTEYIMFKLTGGVISVLDGHLVTNGDNGELVVGACIGGEFILLYEYEEFTRMWGLFGHELGTLQSTVTQIEQFAPFEFSSFLFKWVKLGESTVLVPYRERVQLGLAMCVSERYDAIEKTGDMYSDTMLNRRISLSHRLYDGPLFSWQMIGRYDISENYLINKMSKDIDSVKKFEIAVISVSNTNTESIINYKDFATGEYGKRICRMPISQRVEHYGLPHFEQSSNERVKLVMKDNLVFERESNIMKINIMDTPTLQSVNDLGELRTREIDLNESNWRPPVAGFAVLAEFSFSRMFREVLMALRGEKTYVNVCYDLVTYLSKLDQEVLYAERNLEKCIKDISTIELIDRKIEMYRDIHNQMYGRDNLHRTKGENIHQFMTKRMDSNEI